MLRCVIRWTTCLAVAWCGVGASQAEQFLIVASERSAAYAEATQAVIAELERGGVVRADIAQLTADELGASDPSPKVFISLGASAFQKLTARELRAPVVAALIPRSSFERVLKESDRKSAASVVVLYLDQPWNRQIDLLRLALPDARRVGVLFGSESMVRKPALAAAVQERGMEMVSSVVSDNTLFSELKGILDNTDVVLAVPDPQVFNSATISNLLLSTYRARIPMVAFSPAYVKAGALLSLHSTPAQIGTQAAGMARTVFQGAAITPTRYPAEFTITVNERVAQSLGLQINAAALTERLRRLERKP